MFTISAGSNPGSGALMGSHGLHSIDKTFRGMWFDPRRAIFLSSVMFIFPGILSLCFSMPFLTTPSARWQQVLQWRYDPRTCWTIQTIVTWTWKIQVTQRDSNPWPSRCRCSALTNWATKSHSWEQANPPDPCLPVKGMSCERNVIYEVRCLKSNEDMILTLAGQF